MMDAVPRHPAAAASATLLAGGALGAVVGLGAWLVLRQPPGTIRVLSRQRALVFSVPTTARRVAITIDDGPTPGLTPALLEVLHRHGARATFFLLGSGVEAHPEVVAAIHEAGHEIGTTAGSTGRPPASRVPISVTTSPAPRRRSPR